MSPSDPIPSHTSSTGYRGLLPGMAGVAIYMFVLAGIVGFGVAAGHFPRFFLVVCVLFVMAAVGLARLYRWGWALTCGASFLLMSYGLWAFIRIHQTPALIMSFLNLIFFLYMVRPEVRDRLR